MTRFKPVNGDRLTDSRNVTPTLIHHRLCCQQVGGRKTFCLTRGRDGVTRDRSVFMSHAVSEVPHEETKINENVKLHVKKT